MASISAPVTHVPEPSLLSRLLAFASGPVGYGIKLALLGAVNAIAIWGVSVLATHHHWIALVILIAVTTAIDAIYLIPGLVPGKFLIPGTVFLVAFLIIPIAYTVQVAFTNYSTGHISSKSAAITAIEQNTLQPAGNGASYTMAPAHDSHGTLVLVLVDQATGKAFVGTHGGVTPLPAAGVKVTADKSAILSASGYTLLKGAALAGLDQKLDKFIVPTGKGRAIQPQGLSSAAELEPTLRYDAKRDVFVRISNGTVFHDNGKGAFVAANGEELEPGWKTGVGFKNFSTVANDPLVRRSFLRVLAWTFAYALLSVALTFALGLFLAVVLDKAGMRFQRTYRTILIVPYAMPAFLSALVWGGLLNDDFGVVNHTLHTHVPWLFDANWAKVSCLLLNLWLGFPYFFLVSTAALQAIPAELREAALVDGGTARQIFRKVTFPLLLIGVGPLLIASFAFNFNNFTNIYLLTGGGPPSTDGSVAGGTDILITYVYKVAFAAGKGSDYGLATALSIFIFFIVGSISAVGFWRTNALENLR